MPRGVPRIADKTRTAIASAVSNLLSAKELERLVKNVERESGSMEALKAYNMLLDYILPKLSRVEHAGHDGNALTIDHVLKQVSQKGGSSDLPPIEAEPIEDSNTEKPVPKPLGEQTPYKPTGRLNILAINDKQG